MVVIFKKHYKRSFLLTKLKYFRKRKINIARLLLTREFCHTRVENLPKKPETATKFMNDQDFWYVSARYILEQR